MMDRSRQDRDSVKPVPARQRLRSRSEHQLLLGLALLGLFVFGVPGCAGPARSNDGAILDIEADSAMVSGAAADATTSPDGRPYQFRAVCMEAAMHDGRVAVLSKWMEDPVAARELGTYHGEFKWKGHHYVIERRVKP